MDIVCATDGNYLPHCVAMLQSLKAHHPVEELRVNLIFDSVDLDILLKAVGFLFEQFTSFNLLRADAELVAGFPFDGHASAATYFRLLLPDLLPSNVSRVIFIDSDAIVMADLQELWQLPLEGKALAAVPDHWISCRDHGYVHGEYFNAGIMLIDLEVWRKKDVLGLGRAFAEANPHRLRHWDQDVLNAVFAGQWKTIGERWNACPHLFGLLPTFSLDPENLTASEQLAISGPAIVHFAGPGPVKPWNARSTHPLKSHYLAAKALTPWSATPLLDQPQPSWKTMAHSMIFRAKCKLKGLAQGLTSASWDP
ncbi:MAG: glycosyltransferase family 8 protein [Cyanobium sp.]